MTAFLHALLIAGGLLPPAAMLASLFAAVWLCEGRREREAAASRPHLDSG